MEANWSKGQGALEYLTLIVAVLVIAAVAVYLSSTASGPQTNVAMMTSCKQAAETCKILLREDPDNLCATCEEQCIDPRTKKDILSGTVGCGAACQMCKLGDTLMASTPVADFDVPCCTLGIPCTFDGSPSSDPNSLMITDYLWNFGSQGKVVQYTFGAQAITTSDIYHIKLTVRNSQGTSASVEKILDLNNPPRAVITSVAFGCSSPGPITPSDPTKEVKSYCFSATSSYDPDGDTLDYAWDCGNGQTGTGSTMLCAYEYPKILGTFSATVKLTATETNGCDQSDTRSITWTESSIGTTCSDGTVSGACSATKPLFCNSGKLIADCLKCGCPSGKNCNALLGTCFDPSEPQSKCSDGTFYGSCSYLRPKYCDPNTGLIRDMCSICGCESGYDCDASDNKCKKKCSDGTFYGSCAAGNEPKLCDETGTLVDRCYSCGCPVGDACQPDSTCAPAKMVFAGSADSKVYAIDGTDGAKIWEYSTGGAIGLSSPAVYDKKVYIISADNKVYALNMFTGQKVWEYTDTDMEFAYPDSSPTISGGKVYVGSDFGLYVLDAATGAKQWTYPADFSAATISVEHAPVVSGNLVYFTSRVRGTIYAVDISDHSLEWSTDLDSECTAPLVVEGRVFVGCTDKKLYALDATDGTEIWSYAAENSIWNSPTIVTSLDSLDAYYGDSLVYFTTKGSAPLSTDVYVYALYVSSPAGNTVAGTEHAKYKISFTTYSLYTDPSVMPYQFEKSGTTYRNIGVKIGNGGIYSIPLFFPSSTTWSRDLAALSKSSPVVYGGILYVGSGSKVLALNSSQSQELWGFNTGGTVDSSPTVCDLSSSPWKCLGSEAVGWVNGQDYGSLPE